jgi:hypothetical protein
MATPGHEIFLCPRTYRGSRATIFDSGKGSKIPRSRLAEKLERRYVVLPEKAFTLLDGSLEALFAGEILFSGGETCDKVIKKGCR